MLSLAVVLAALAVVPALCDEVYDVVDLGTLGGASSAANAINDRGVIVGSSVWTNGETHAFIWSNGVMSKLLSQAWITNSAAYDINSNGAVVGRANTVSGMLQGFYFDALLFTNIGVFAGGNASVARAVNHRGDVAGQAHYWDGQYMFPHAALWTNGTLVSLHAIIASLSSEGYDVNQQGQTVGFYYGFNPYTFYHAFVWQDTNTDGAADNGEFSDLGTLGGVVSQAYGVNELGQVVGASTLEGYAPWHAFLVTPQFGQWDDDRWSGTITNSFMMDLGTLGGTDSFAYAINDAGVIVGSAATTSGEFHAFVLELGVMSDLNTMVESNSAWILTSALAVNSSGHIVGQGIVSGQSHGFLLVPASNRVTLTRVNHSIDSATSGLWIYWSGRGSNLGFTVESAENATSGVWQVIPPTNQWPTPMLFWSHPSALGPTLGVFRIRAASY